MLALSQLPSTLSGDVGSKRGSDCKLEVPNRAPWPTPLDSTLFTPSRLLARPPRTLCRFDFMKKSRKRRLMAGLGAFLSSILFT